MEHTTDTHIPSQLQPGPDSMYIRVQKPSHQHRRRKVSSIHGQTCRTRNTNATTRPSSQLVYVPCGESTTTAPLARRDSSHAWNKLVFCYPYQALYNLQNVIPWTPYNATMPVSRCKVVEYGACFVKYGRIDANTLRTRTNANAFMSEKGILFHRRSRRAPQLQTDVGKPSKPKASPAQRRR